MGGRDVEPDEGPRLAQFEPDPSVPHTNGSRIKRRRGVANGLTLAVLGGALVAASLVPRVQWLNLSRIGPWWRLVVPALVAGALAGALGARGRRSWISGALAGGLSLLAVYVILRLTVRVLWVGRSPVRVISADLGRLVVHGAPAGALAAGLAAAARGRLRAGRLGSRD